MNKIYAEELRNISVRYEVHRERCLGRAKAGQSPLVEEFLGLDRARLAALAVALDGPTYTADRFTGVVRIFEVLYQSSIERKRVLIDELDERVAARVLTDSIASREGTDAQYQRVPIGA